MRKVFKVILNIILIVAIIVVSIIAVLALLYFVHGSLEMFPTEEQQEAERIVMMFIFVICMIIDCGLIVLKKVLGRK